MTLVTLYGREGCHLCDEAREAIMSMRARGIRLELREIDIESDERLHAAFLERIPVVEIGGAVVSELAIDEPSVRSALTSRQ